MFSRIRGYFDHPYRVLAWLLVVSALTMMLLIIGATQALAANITGTFTYPTKFVDGTPLTLAQIERMRIEYGSCAGSAFGAKEGEVVVTPPATSYTITGLAPGQYCLRAFTKATAAAGGLESDSTNVLQHSVAWPKPEPGTLVTVATTARLLVPTRWGDQVGHVVGKVELGTECGAQRKGEWHEVSRETIALNRWGEQLPSTAVIVAKCRTT